MVTEDELYVKLMNSLKSGKMNVSKSEIKIIPNYRFNDSPDFVVELNLTLLTLGHRLDLRVNIPIELEKAGLKEALLDLDKFVKRNRFSNEIPMLVISAHGLHSLIETRQLTTSFVIQEIPERLV